MDEDSPVDLQGIQHCNIISGSGLDVVAFLGPAGWKEAASSNANGVEMRCSLKHKVIVNVCVVSPRCQQNHDLARTAPIHHL
jgi:hypothetical protein